MDEAMSKQKNQYPVGEWTAFAPNIPEPEGPCVVSFRGHDMVWVPPGRWEEYAAHTPRWVRVLPPTPEPTPEQARAATWRRLLEAGKVQYTEGMLVDGWRLGVLRECSSWRALRQNVARLDWSPVADSVPNFADPATLGCLMAQMRERCGEAASLRPWGSERYVAGVPGTRQARPTRIDAILAALEAS